MKSLQESLFDDDLVAKKLERDPGTIAWEWNLSSASPYYQTDAKSVFKMFDKSYMKEHLPTEEELMKGVEYYYNKFEVDSCKKCNRIAKVVSTWKMDDVINYAKSHKKEHININFQSYKEMFPGLNNDANATITVFMTNSVFTKKEELEIIVRNNDERQKSVYVYFNER